MTMNCKLAQRELALWVGGDHDPLLQEMLTEHVQGCPDCRAFAREIQVAGQVLRQAAVHAGDGARSGDSEWSLWPRVQARLQRTAPRESRYAPATVGWFPVAGLTVACMALITISFSSVQSHRGDSGFDLPAGQQYLVPANSQVFGLNDAVLQPGLHRWAPQGREQLPSEQEIRKMLSQLRLQQDVRSQTEAPLQDQLPGFQFPLNGPPSQP